MKRSAVASFLVGLLLAFAILASTAVYGIETVKMPDGRVLIVWTPEEMAKLEDVLSQLVEQRKKAQDALIKLQRQCT